MKKKSTHIIVNMMDRIRYTSILCLRRVKIVGQKLLSLQSHILQHGILVNRTVNIRLRLLGEVDGFGVAAALKIEDAVLVPAVLVIANECTVRIGRKCCGSFGLLMCMSKRSLEREQRVPGAHDEI